MACTGQGVRLQYRKGAYLIMKMNAMKKTLAAVLAAATVICPMGTFGVQTAVTTGSSLLALAANTAAVTVSASAGYLEGAYAEWQAVSGASGYNVYADGNKIDYQIITDTSEWDIAGKNMAFIMGDQPLEHMHNPDLDDGSTCLIIIDSYGCYFVPWLVDSYEDLWVADFRYFNGSYSNLIAENNIEDVIVLNNVSLAGGGVVPDAILGKW